MPARRRLRSLCAATVPIILAAICAIADAANYDTSWSYVYEGGTTKAGKSTFDSFRDAKPLASGGILCVGGTQDSADQGAVLAVRLSSDGKPNRTRLYSFPKGAMGASLVIGKSGNPIIGGNRYIAPLLLRLDTALEPVSAAWHYDSIADKDRLSMGATLNSLLELDDGRIVAAAGDIFPDNLGFTLNNYAAFMEFDASGAFKRSNQWLNSTGYEIAGWSIARGETYGYLLGGKQAAFLLDSTGVPVSRREYSFSLPGVGTVINNVSRLGKLPSGQVMAIGQAYEEDCWTRYQRLSHDAWWTPLGSGGGEDARYVAGLSGAHDYLYDFASLADGRIAFLGAKGTDPDSGLWVFVTDSSAKTVIWEKQYNLPGKDNGSPRQNLLPLRITAMPDTGFLLTGIEVATGNNNNGFVIRVVPKPVPLVSAPFRSPAAVKARWAGGAFAFETDRPCDIVLEVTDFQGRSVSRRSYKAAAGRNTIAVPEARSRGGLLLWRMTLAGGALSGKQVF